MMTKEEVIAKLEEIAKRCEDDAEPYYNEDAHWDADMVLLEYINDDEIKYAWRDVPKWYS